MNIENASMAKEEQEIFEAAKVGDLARVKKLILQGVSLAPSDANWTVLGVAAEHGHEHLVEYLLSENNLEQKIVLQHIDVMWRQECGSAVYWAANRGHLGIVKRLVQAGAKLLPNKERTPVEAAKKNNQQAVVDYLLEIEKNPALVVEVRPASSIFDAVREGNLALFQQRMMENVSLLDPAANNLTVLIFAASRGCSSIVEYLLSYDNPRREEVLAILDSTWSSTGGTALHEAVDGRNLDIVKRLVEAGASLSRLNKCGDTPIRIAKRNGCQDVIDYLQAAEKWSPFVTAERNRLQEKRKRMLLEKEIETKIQAIQGNQQISEDEKLFQIKQEVYQSIAEGPLFAVELWVEVEKALNPSFDPTALLQLACDVQHFDVIDFLLKSGLFSRKEDYTPFLEKYLKENESIAVLFIANKAGTTTTINNLIVEKKTHLINAAIDLLAREGNWHKEIYEFLHRIVGNNPADFLSKDYRIPRGPFSPSQSKKSQIHRVQQYLKEHAAQEKKEVERRKIKEKSLQKAKAKTAETVRTSLLVKSPMVQPHVDIMEVKLTAQEVVLPDYLLMDTAQGAPMKEQTKEEWYPTVSAHVFDENKTLQTASTLNDERMLWNQPVTVTDLKKASAPLQEKMESDPLQDFFTAAPPAEKNEVPVEQKKEDDDWIWDIFYNEADPAHEPSPVIATEKSAPVVAKQLTTPLSQQKSALFNKSKREKFVSTRPTPRVEERTPVCL